MEFLEQARALLDTLKKRSKEYDQVKKELSVASLDGAEKLYAEEFEIAVEMASVFETLTFMLDRMEQNEDSKFIATRLRTQAEAAIGGIEEYGN